MNGVRGRSTGANPGTRALLAWRETKATAESPSLSPELRPATPSACRFLNFQGPPIERIHLRDRVGKCVRSSICAESGGAGFDELHAAFFCVATHSRNRNHFRMAKRRSFLAELLEFIVQNKAWVIAPIILVLRLALERWRSQWFLIWLFLPSASGRA